MTKVFPIKFMHSLPEVVEKVNTYQSVPLQESDFYKVTLYDNTRLIILRAPALPDKPRKLPPVNEFDLLVCSGPKLLPPEYKEKHFKPNLIGSLYVYRVTDRKGQLKILIVSTESKKSLPEGSLTMLNRELSRSYSPDSGIIDFSMGGKDYVLNPYGTFCLTGVPKMVSLPLLIKERKENMPKVKVIT